MQIYDEALRDTGIRMTQFMLLIAICSSGRVKMKELAESTVMDRTSLTRSIALLEKGGLVRMGLGSDRRAKYVSLTQAGRQRLQEAYPGWREAQDRAKEILGEAHLKETADSLNKALDLFFNASRSKNLSS